MNSLIHIDDLPASSLKIALKLNEIGLLPIIENSKSKLISFSQFKRLKALLIEGEKSQFQVELVPMHFELCLGKNTCLIKSRNDKETLKGLEVLIQLLPSYLENLPNDFLPIEATMAFKYEGSSYEIRTNNSQISESLKNHLNDFYDVIKRKHLILARSANYLGSKATFTPAICAIVETHTGKDSVVLDLMCGAGSVSGAISHIRSVIASDAQLFSRNLAKVQGGGLDIQTAEEILSNILNKFNPHFESLKPEIYKDLEKEDKYISSDITEDNCKSFLNWVSRYPRVGNDNLNLAALKNKLESYIENNNKLPGILFTRYYANLFFGVRQSAEIDSLRTAISELKNPIHKKWALGALTATISYCAYNYGGHFAQPKMNVSNAFSRKQLKAILQKRTISVNHEFSARLLSLAKESEQTLHEIQDVEGPWEDAIVNAEKLIGDKEVLVYLDPPYTRDEFSRYYHVLETLMHYNYPETTGKASVPLKGTKGRFRSSFFTRNKSNVEDLLVKIILECLDKGWSCLFSYSSSGLANIANVIQRLDEKTSRIEIYSSNHLYRGQGKQKSKEVVEYFILLVPKPL